VNVATHFHSFHSFHGLRDQPLTRATEVVEVAHAA
jgi:hypothetical protein